MVAAEGPPGSVLLWDTATWHRFGSIKSDDVRFHLGGPGLLPRWLDPCFAYGNDNGGHGQSGMLITAAQRAALPTDVRCRIIHVREDYLSASRPAARSRVPSYAEQVSEQEQEIAGLRERVRTLEARL